MLAICWGDCPAHQPRAGARREHAIERQTPPALAVRMYVELYVEAFVG
jgi:hypothetical protein